MGYPESDRALTLLKREKETLWLNEVPSVALQQALRDLQTAFANFFAKRSAYPTFRKKSARATARYTRSAFRYEAHTQRLFLAKMGALRVKWDRSLPSEPSTCSVIRSASGRYFVSFVVDIPDPEPLPATGQEVGIDFGVSRLATLSTGERIANPQHGAKRAKRLAALQRRLARKQKGSRRRMLARRAVARCHEKIANARKDNLEKLTTRIVREFDVIYIEDLNLRGMVKNHALARALSDVGIGMAVRMLKRKAESGGKRVVHVDRFFPSSKMCSCCGRINSALKLVDREWQCVGCGTHHDRDDNASTNIKAAGQAVAAHGEGVRDMAPTGVMPNLQ